MTSLVLYVVPGIVSRFLLSVRVKSIIYDHVYHIPSHVSLDILRTVSRLVYFVSSLRPISFRVLCMCTVSVLRLISCSLLYHVSFSATHPVSCTVSTCSLMYCISSLTLFRVPYTCTVRVSCLIMCIASGLLYRVLSRVFYNTSCRVSSVLSRCIVSYMLYYVSSYISCDVFCTVSILNTELKGIFGGAKGR